MIPSATQAIAPINIDWSHRPKKVDAVSIALIMVGLIEI